MGKIMQIFPLHGISSILTDFEVTVGVLINSFSREKQLAKSCNFFGFHGISSILTVLESNVCRCQSDFTTPFSRERYWQNHANFLIT